MARLSAPTVQRIRTRQLRRHPAYRSRPRLKVSFRLNRRRPTVTRNRLHLIRILLLLDIIYQ